MNELLLRRRVASAKPYDAEIEYLQSTGTQYINLSFGFDPTDEINTSFVIGSGQTSDKYINAPNRWNTNNNRFGFGCHNDGFCFAYGSLSTTNGVFQRDYDHVNILNWVYKDKIISIPSLGKSKNVSSIGFGSTTANIRLFYGYNANTKCKISYYKHIKGNGVGVEFIPVRIGQVGYMYDKVSGRLFGNVGTGSFVLGPDK